MSSGIWSDILEDERNQKQRQEFGNVIVHGANTAKIAKLLDRLCGHDSADGQIYILNYLSVYTKQESTRIRSTLKFTHISFNFADFLKLSLCPNMKHNANMIVLDCDEPGVTMAQLRRYYLEMAEFYTGIYGEDTVEERRVYKRQTYEHLYNDMTFCTEYCGTDIVVVLLDWDNDVLKFDEHNKLLYQVREFCHVHGAALVSLSLQNESTITSLREYLFHLILDQPLPLHTNLSNISDCFIPIGGDSAQSLRETLEIYSNLDIQFPLPQPPTGRFVDKDKVMWDEEEQQFLLKMQKVLTSEAKELHGEVRKVTRMSVKEEFEKLLEETRTKA
ncbi:unnamed protein product [Bursaphelenchus okinawaensis]|uniref:Dynein light intermediate chain n=1 Tax=Bursaphelenchus okinawaensis TaxID=465554 RepID=A0A811KQV3_9BILA|nr:unnamed protein product [Bursaphelenchus okinawaensis]CAG9108251.1 unnamed protein product [Bursaphelenchus okinawaensis]